MKNKIFIGLISGVIIYLITFIVLKGTNSVKNESSYYDKIAFDFIVPKPWYTQIAELEQMDFISTVTPYYMTNKTASLNGHNYNIDFYIVENGANLYNTPYTPFLLIKGNLPTENEALLDKKAADITNAAIGDTVSVTIGNETLKLKISGFVDINKFAAHPTALMYYTNSVKKAIESTIAHLSYSGAYIDVNNLAAAENYFNNVYRAKGKIGERGWYKDDNAYNYMKKSIKSANVAKEITNVSLLKANSYSKFQEAAKSNIQILFLAIIIQIIIYSLIWMLFLYFSSKTYRKRINNGEKASIIIIQFRIGEIFSAILNCLLLFLTKELLGITSTYCLIISNIVCVFFILIYTTRIIKRP